ncbi:Nif11-like leader peptide family natural product precursor [Elusimicrobiota bacterium]
MSLESAAAFVEKMKTDAKFAKLVQACKDAAARAQLVKKEGFDFTGDEVKQAASELSEDELRGIAGGHAWCSGVIPWEEWGDEVG